MVEIDNIGKLSKMLKPISKEQDADAAVALLLRPENQDVEILFVKRVRNLADPWSGQIALPGGKRDAIDRNLKETVIRETLEETNINLLSYCRFLGTMTALTSTQRPEMKILPFVILLEHEQLIKLNEELEWFMWITLKELIKNRGTAEFGFGEFPAYIIRRNAIWGLTYRIIEKFIHIVKYSL